jgi:putative ABC transport system permease protein
MVRLYRWLIRLAPPALRREYGAAMEDTFVRRLNDARALGLWRRGWVCGREVAGVFGLLLSERWGAAARLRRQQQRAQSRAKAGRMDGITQDIGHAARRLMRAPAFTLATIATLALAIGANSAIFAVVHRVVLNPLPFGDSHRLVALRFAMPSRNVSAVYSIPSRFYYEYLDRARTLDGLAFYVPATNPGELTLTGRGDPERVRFVAATPSLLSVLRVAPAHGRWFTESEGVPGATPVAVISQGLWFRRYGQDRRVLGSVVTLDGVPTTIIGIMPASFRFPDPRVEVWTPATLSRATANDGYQFGGIARLRAGATIENARTELTRLTAGLESAYPANGYKALVSTAATLLDATVADVSRTLWILLASVGLLLLLACANVANLFLVRSDARQREIAVRRALGAGGRAVARYFLTESLLLSLLGGALGVALAALAVRLVALFGPANLPRLHEVRLDGVVFVFAAGLSVVTALAFGSIPLLRFPPLAATLHEIGRGHTASRARHRARHLLMAGQVALALVLLVCSGLMLRSFQRLRAVEPGFDAASALTFEVGFPRNDYSDRRRLVATQHAIIDRLAALPGVTGVSASTCLPLSERQLCQGGPLFVEGRQLPPGAIPPFVAIRAVAGDYFRVLGMPILRGRGIESSDGQREQPVAVINEAFSRMVFPNQDPIGRRVRLGNPALSPGVPEWLTVAGVVSNTPTFALSETAPFPQLFMPMFASRDVNMAPRLNAVDFVVRTAQTPLASAESARRAIREVDPNLALAQVRTLQDTLDRAAAQMAFTMALLMIAAAVALMLGVVGIYGVMSYVVTQRTGEIGVRLALGAKPASVAGAIVWQGGLVTLAGIAVGLLTAAALSRALESLLFGVSPRDPAVFAVTTLLLLSVALLACWLPARRGARLSPLEALRSE